jgi:hypothetical protein
LPRRHPQLLVIAPNSGLITIGAASDVHVRGAFSNAGLVDIAGGTLQLDQGITSSTIIAQINSGYDRGAWDGTSGITSSLAALNPAAAIGYENTGNSYTLMYTWIGDTNLDGVVDASDFAAISPTGTTWSTGDFNYDGQVNADDYALFMLGLSESGGANIFATLPEPSLILASTFCLVPSFRRCRRGMVCRAAII